MKTSILNYLRFTRAERNGTIALTLLAATLFLIPEITHWVRPRPTTDFSPFRQQISSFKEAVGNPQNLADNAGNALFEFDPNTASFEDFLRLGLSEKVANIICNYRDKGGNFQEPEDFQKIWSLKKEDFERLLPFIRIHREQGFAKNSSHEKPKSFPFDPNNASESELLQLGLPRWTVKSILNYRAKGGKFRSAEDLGKIYTLSEDDFSRLAPYVKLSEPTASAEIIRPVAYAGGMASLETRPTTSTLVDINLADAETWKTLPGIGEGRAKQLVNFREKLGGFASVNQVGELYNLPDSIFQRIKPRLTLRPGTLKKLNLNAASVAELDAHPYISKRQAELIVAYRGQHGAFASVESLAKTQVLSDPNWLAKISPYLCVE